MTAKPWFANGLSFECTRCGNCCTGEPGFVWVNEGEIAELAAVCGETPDRFRQLYTYEVGKRRSLVELGDGSCVFFRPGFGCTVYEQRPRQCRTWPFWESNLESEATWGEVAKNCPGMGQGRLYSVDEVIARSSVMRI